MGCHRNKRAEYRVKGTDIPAKLMILCGRYVRKLLAIRACGENCVLATQVG